MLYCSMHFCIFSDLHKAFIDETYHDLDFEIDRTTFSVVFRFLAY